MNRRKGVPCGCDADPCGCSPKNHCVKAINNVSPDPNGVQAAILFLSVFMRDPTFRIDPVNGNTLKHPVTVRQFNFSLTSCHWK